MAHSQVAAPGATCLACGQVPVESVALLDQHGIPPAEDGHNIVYGHTRIGLCPRCGSLQVERLDHDCFAFESVWDQFEWYVLDREALPALRQLLSRCPDPLDPTCDCAIHRRLRAECSRLPSSGWTSALEAEHHVHLLRLGIKEGRLHLEPADVPPTNRSAAP